MQRLPAATLLIVGTVVAVDPWGQWPFGPLRWLVVSVVGTAVWWLSLRRPGPVAPRRMRQLWWVLLAFLGVSALVHHDVWVALTGTATRHFGWLTWLLCGALFAAGARMTNSFGQLQRACAIACACIGVWCTWELAVGPPIAVGVTTDRLLGPFGSAAITGAALCLFLPPTVALAAGDASSRPWRLLGVGGSGLGVLATLGTGTRAAWVGVCVAGAVAVWAARPPFRRVAWVGGALAVALVAAGPWLRTVGDRSEGNTSRVDEWAVSARVLAGHPLLGVGPEGYRLVVDDGIDAGYERAHSRDTVLPDRAHSAPLDVALAGGVPAAVAYLALVAFVWVAAIRRLRRPLDPAVAGIAAGVIAYSAAQFFLFPLSELDPLLWLLAGALVAVPAGAAAHHPGRQRVAVTALGVTAVGVLVVGGVLEVAADHLAKQALTASSNGDRATAVDAATQATELRPDSTAYRMVAVQVLLASGSLHDIDAAIAQANEAVQWSPHDPIAVDLQAGALLQRAIATGTDNDVAAAVHAWQALVQRDPHRARWQLQLGRAAAQADDAALARQAWTAAAALGSDEAAALLAGLPS